MRVRIALYAVGTLALAVAFSPALIASVFATAASVLCEAVPFLLGGAILQKLTRDDRLVAYFGCGCTRGPSARSIPAAVATAMLFGIWVALARLIAACVVASTICRHANRHACAPQRTLLLGDLQALTFAALLTGLASQATAYVNVAVLSPALAALAGLALGFLAAPCALGAVAVAAALHGRAPLAATSFLCVAGIVDMRALFWRRPLCGGADVTAYLMVAAALAIVAARHGDALVHPAIVPVLACGSVVALVCALRYRRQSNPAARFSPALMLAGVLVVAPPPPYTATETTLTDMFAGERLRFTGRLARNRNSAALVRYAITCCRADAAPVVLRLDTIPSLRDGTWALATGSIENVGGDFRLRASQLKEIASPADPFIYR